MTPYQSIAQSDDVEVRLAYIYQLLDYTVWPGSYAIDANPNIEICYMGQDEVSQRMKILEQASTSSHRIIVRKIGVKQIRQCHIVYFAYKNVSSFKEAMNEASKFPILTFSSAENFVTKGGIIGFEKMTRMLGNFEENRISFTVNRSSANKVGLRIDPSALAFAKGVIE